MIINANALHIPLADSSVHCVVTSPPYYALRDYGVNGQLGLEKTPEQYIANMVSVFREVWRVWRVMRDDGTLWLNIGDSYASGKGKCINPGGGKKSYIQEKERYPLDRGNVSTLRECGLKQKDLIGIPWMLAFALRADGWYLRQEIIWHKPSPMPESVTDRCTKSHETLFLLTKSSRYFYDYIAIKEPSSDNDWQSRYNRSKDGNKSLPTEQVNGIRARKPAGWDTGKGSHGSIHKDGRAQEVEYYETTDPTRNKRSVWSIATQAMPMAHFATYPEKLVEPCILAGTSSRGVCPKCGAPWSRVVDKKFIPQPDVTQERVNFHRYTDGVPGNQWRGVPRGIIHSNTINWKSGCACNVGDPVPAIVLDPFFGSGTTGLVALSLGRRFIGMDLSMTYLREIAKKRLITQIGTGL